MEKSPGDNAHASLIEPVFMFNPMPPRTKGELVLRLPDELRDGDLEAGWNAAQPAGLGATSFLEGPSFDTDGALWFVDVVNGRVLRWSASSQLSVELQYDGWPNGLKIHADGRIFIADHKHGIMVYDRESRKLSALLERHGIDRFKALNDLFFARNGDLYFTDQGLTGLHDPTGRLFRLSARGELDCLLANVPSPNGLVMDLEERTVFLAATRDNSVWRVPLGRDRRPIKVGRFVQLSGGVGPDGLAISECGELLVAHAGLGCVWVYSPEGELVLRIDAPEGKLVTNLAFQPNTSILHFIESATASIYRANAPHRGRPMYSHQTTTEP
jgi:gluconolactonase